MVSKMAAKKQLKITLVKSLIGRLPAHKLTIECLGLKKVNSTVIQNKCDSIQGMINKVNYLLKVEEIG